MFYAPLRYSVYRTIWIATLFSNLGTWVHTVTASLLMTKLSHSPIMISLVQAAAFTPIFIFSIPGGVLADYYNKKSIIISAHLFMSVSAMLMAMMSYFGIMTDWLLLCMTFLLNIGLAFNQPAWQAISSTLIPQEEIKQSAALNNLSFNISRCIGPAIAGYFYSSLGPSCLFSLNALSFVGVIIAFRSKVKINNPINCNLSFMQLIKGCKRGFLFLNEFPLFKFLIGKAFCFFLLSSCLWATLPYLIIVYNHLPNEDLGIAISAGGIGAITCASSIYYLRHFLSDNQLTTLSLFLAGLVILLIGKIHSLILFCFIVFVFGFAWSLSVSVFNGILQSEFPLQTRSRLIGIYSVFFAAAQALGSYLSGNLMHLFGAIDTLWLIAIMVLVMSLYYLNKSYPEHIGV